MSWYTKTIPMTQNQIEKVIEIFGRRPSGTLPKHINLERVKYILENYITKNNKPYQIEIGRKFNVGREGIRCHIARIWRVCDRVCGKSNCFTQALEDYVAEKYLKSLDDPCPDCYREDCDCCLAGECRSLKCYSCHSKDFRKKYPHHFKDKESSNEKEKKLLDSNAENLPPRMGAE